MIKLFKVGIKVSVMERMPYGRMCEGDVFLIKHEVFKGRHKEGFY